MKKIYTFLLLIAVTTTMVTAQNKDTKKADDLYKRLAYTDAADAYEKLIKKGKADKYVFEQLANSYFYINDTKKAETYYNRAVKGKNVDPETVYNYAQSLKANGKFEEYNTWMKQFAEMKPADSRSMDFMRNPNYIPKIMGKKPKFSTTNLQDINSKYSDFGGVIVGNQFYFASARNTSRKTYGWDEQPYLEIYKANIVGETVKDADLLKGDVNTKYHEGNMAISPDGKRMYFDRNDYYDGHYDKSEEGINQINLFYAENVDGSWKDIHSVDFNDDNYSTGHPALSPDGNTLYFSSDMPGGKGKSDIYKVTVNKDGSLGKPERLGDNINTEGKEVFPYVDSNGTLYFSSDGHLGIGGLDVFYTEANGNAFGSVKNMGVGVNSTDDDFAFKLNPETQMGYVSSNRKGGKGSDDIYLVKQLEPLCDVTINVTVVDATNQAPLSAASVTMYDGFENLLNTTTSDANGNTSFTAECDKEHVIQAVLENYESNAVTVDASSENEVSVTIALRPIEEIIQGDAVVLNPIFFDFDKHNIKSQAAFELDKLVSLMKKYPEMVIKVEGHTDNRGSDAYNMDLSERRSQSTVQYVISKGIDKSRISGQGFGESRPAIDCGTNCTEAQHQKNRRSEFKIVKQ